MVDLPPEVHVVRNARTGRTYYYWAPGRGTSRAGERQRIPGTPEETRFWVRIDELKRDLPDVPPGSLAAIVRAYRASREFLDLAESTRRTYDVTLRRLEDPALVGLAQAAHLSPLAVLRARDSMAETPVMANQMLAVGRTLFDWAIPLGLVAANATNPYDKVKDLKVADRGHLPWPQWAVDAVLSAAPADVTRFLRIALMTGQRESDVLRFGPDHRERNGLWCRPQKTNRVRRAFFIPLGAAEALMLDRWSAEPMTFTAARWKAPIARHNPELYVYGPNGKAYTPMGFRARWHRFLASPAGTEIVKAWREWVTVQVARFGWAIDPEDVGGPTLHGLRGTAVGQRREAGYEAQAIANDIGMSLQMVMHYTRFIDQMAAAEANRRRFEVIR